MEHSYPVKAEYLGARKLKIAFADGKEGVLDLALYIERDTVFARFAEDAYFLSYRINPELRVLEWPGGVDIAPETLYHEATGSPLPKWMDQ